MGFIKSGKELVKSKFVKDTIWLTIAQFVLAVSGIIINIIIGNKYGSDGLGVFNQALAIFLLLSAFSGLGLNNTTIKKVSEDPNNTENLKLILNSNLLVSTLISLLVLVLGYLVIDKINFLFSSKQVAYGIKFLLYSFPLYGINKILMSFLSGLRMQKQFSIARIIRWFSLIILIIIVSSFTNSIKFIYLSFIVSETLLLSYLLVKCTPFVGLYFSKITLVDNLSFGLQSYVSEVIAFAKDKLEIILTGYFLSKNEMGIFTFSYSFAAGILIFPSVIMQNFNPIISKLWFQSQIEELKLKIAEIRKKMVIILFPIVLFLFVFYNFLLQYFTNLPITEYLFVFNIMLLGFFLLSVVSWLGSFLIMTHNLYLNIKRVTLLLLFSLISITSMAFYFGILGAALAVFLSAVFALIIIISFVKKILK